MEVYNTYDAAEKGGPLMFIIMMKKLQVDTDAAVQYLQTSVKQMKITNFDGEDVSRVVSLIRGAHRRLQGVGANKVPVDFSKQITAVLQTSTVPEFNDMFSYLNNMKEVEQRMNPDVDHWPKPDVILDMAESKYLELHHIDKWTGVTTKANQSVFKASHGKVPPTYKCFNCNGNHLLTLCPVIKDEARIEKNKAAFKKAKQEARANKNSNSPNGGAASNTTTNDRKVKFKAPIAGESLRRLIDGQWYKYLTKRKRWVKERQGATPGATPTAAAASTAPTTPAVPVVQTPAVPSSAISTITTDTTRTAVREAALQNAAHMVNVAMRGMVDACREPN
jgi:hypothetical protein